MHSIGLALVDSELKVCMMISAGCDDQMTKCPRSWSRWFGQLGQLQVLN